MICPVCTRDPCICQSRHWNHWVESDTLEKFDAFVKSLQKNPGLVQREQIDHYVAQLQELRRNPDHTVTSINIDSLGGGFPKDGVPLLHSGVRLWDEELIYPKEPLGKSGLGVESLMNNLRAKRKRQHTHQFWVDKQRPSWAGGRGKKRGKR